MGCVQSAGIEDIEAKTRVNEAIDNQIARDGLLAKNEKTVLVLGAEQSGKSTILKNLRLLSNGGFNNSERESYKERIFGKILQSMRTILEDLSRFELSLTPDNDVHRAAILALPPKFEGEEIPPNISDAIRSLWNNPNVQNAVSVGGEIKLDELAAYYLNSIDRIASPSYLPTDEDILMSTKMQGINKAVYKVGELTYNFLDLSRQRGQLENWIHCFEGVSALVYVVSMNDYDDNRMQETLTHFDSICNSQWFARTSIILFLNKIDLFAEKLPHMPLGQFFPDYTAGNNYDAACDYLLHRFVSLNRSAATKKIYASFTSANDTHQTRFILSAIQDILLQLHLREEKLI